MANNRELSEFGDFLTVDDTTKNVGIGTTLKITAGGIFVNDTEIVRPDGTWGGSSSGLVGAQGAQGVQGAVGAQGAQGVQGTNGVDGAQGAQGVQGAVGAQGAQGRQGAVGAQGAAGAQGNQGVQGAAGAQGNQGRQGSVGAQGAQGRQGATGAQGVQGATGPVGGSNTQVLFNDGGSTGGDAGLTFNKTTNVVQVGDQHRFGLGTFTTPQRNAGVSTANGTMIYNSTTEAIEGYGPAGWATVKELGAFEATGGTKITSGTNVYHVFSYPSSDNFVVSSGTADIELLLVGGGGGGAVDDGGGAGAGGVVYGPAIPVSPGTYNVTVGRGGTFNTDRNNNTNTWGSPSEFVHPVGTITAYGGQGSCNTGGSPYPVLSPWGGSNATKWGSGAGGRVTNPSSTEAPIRPISEGQPSAPTFNSLVTNYGNTGGPASNAYLWNGGGGGGAGGAGSSSAPGNPRNGGDGQPFPSFPAPVISPAIPAGERSAFESAVGPTGLFGGGGAGGVENPAIYSATGGSGGGGDAATPWGGRAVYGTGGGAGHTASSHPSNSPVPDHGGAGIVIVKYSTV